MTFYKKYKFSVWMTAILLVVSLVGVMATYQKASQEQQVSTALRNSGDAPIAQLDATEYDWGDISRTEVIEQDFTLSNPSSNPLLITRVVTSCGCTTAELLINGQAQEYPAKLPAQAEAIIHVEFDPDAHDSRGDTKRAVRIETNDPENPFLIINLTANVR